MADLTLQSKLKEYRVRAENAGLSLVFSHTCTVANAGRNSSGQYRIEVPMPSSTWSARRLVQWHYELEHEIGHLLPVAVDAYDVLQQKKVKCDSFTGYMYNIAVDHWQEHMDINLYAGRRQRISEGRKVFLEDQPADRLGKGVQVERLAGEAYYVWDTLIREEWLPSLSGIGSNMLQYMTEQQLEWIEKLQAGDYESTLKSGISAQEVYDLVLRVIKEVFEFPEEQSDEEGNEQLPKEGNSDSDEEQQDADGPRDGDAANGKGNEVSEDEGTDKQDAAETVKYSDLLAHQHQDDKDSKDDRPYASHIDYDTNSCDFKQKSPDKYRILDYTQAGADVELREYGKDLLEEIRRIHVSDSLAKHVRRLLQVRKQARYQHGLKRGKVSPKSIYRGGLNTSAQDKIFKKRQEQDVTDTAVTVLIDMSGSMYGKKAAHAAISMRLLNEAIGTINVPLEIVAFCEERRWITHAILKNFAKSVTSEDLITRCCAAGDSMFSSNSDGESILWVMDRLTKRKESRKILIVLSDGQPAANGGDADWFTKEVIKEIEKRGAVEIYGIGIMDTNVTRLYKDHAVIKNANELEAALLKVIEHKILG